MQHYFWSISTSSTNADPGNSAKTEKLKNIMSLFANLNTSGLEQSTDRLGGYSCHESGSYTGKIKVAYAGKSAGGAHSVSLIVNLDNNGGEYRETLYITNKNGQNFFLNKQDPTKKVPLPGFTIIDDICLVTTGKPLSEQSTEDKIINIWDSEAKKELPKSVPVLTDLIGQTVTLGILKQLQNKSEKVGNNYVPTAETREANVIDKVFHTETKMTVAEARQGAEAAKFHDSWVERNAGNTQDKRTLKDGAGGQVGAPKRAEAPSAPPQSGAPARKSLFGSK